MFLGHLAVGFAAKRLAPETSLGVLLGASEFIDILFPAFVLAGIEGVKFQAGDNPFLVSDYYYPFSHSLVMTLVWAVAAAGVYWLLARRVRAAAVTGAVVLSHWFLDLASHKPDLPLTPSDSPMLGLGLWYSVPGTIAVELALFTAGVWLYASATRPRDRRGRYGFWSLVAVFVAIYFSMVAGPPPPSAASLAWVGLAFSAFFLWAAWADRHREAVLPPGA